MHVAWEERNLLNNGEKADQSAGKNWISPERTGTRRKSGKRRWRVAGREGEIVASDRHRETQQIKKLTGKRRGTLCVCVVGTAKRGREKAAGAASAAAAVNGSRRKRMGKEEGRCCLSGADREKGAMAAAARVPGCWVFREEEEHRRVSQVIFGKRGVTEDGEMGDYRGSAITGVRNPSCFGQGFVFPHGEKEEAVKTEKVWKKRYGKGDPSELRVDSTRTESLNDSQKLTDSVTKTSLHSSRHFPGHIDVGKLKQYNNCVELMIQRFMTFIYSFVEKARELNPIELWKLPKDLAMGDLFCPCQGNTRISVYVIACFALLYVISTIGNTSPYNAVIEYGVNFCFTNRNAKNAVNPSCDTVMRKVVETGRRETPQA
ncbi:hypothetical protein LXL04_011082 [Taraxacum kok-saghyz]